jgi:hypothetical protein
MPKLYHHADAWQVPGRQDRKAKRVDVPSSPPELAAWLNSRRVPLEGDAFDGLVPGNTAADELLGEIRGQAAADGEQPWILGPVTKDPPRYSTSFLADAASGAEFVPVTKAAEMDRLLARCPMCHNSEAAALDRRDRLDFDGIMAWVRDRATSLELDDLADLIEEKRQ